MAQATWYVVVHNGMGRYAQGQGVKAEELGGDENITRLMDAGAVREATPSEVEGFEADPESSVPAYALADTPQPQPPKEYIETALPEDEAQAALDARQATVREIVDAGNAAQEAIDQRDAILRDLPSAGSVSAEDAAGGKGARSVRNKKVAEGEAERGFDRGGVQNVAPSDADAAPPKDKK